MSAEIVTQERKPLRRSSDTDGIEGAMTKISSRDFQQDFKSGIKNDTATQERLNKAGVDGKKMLDGADTNKDGKIEGAEELKGLFKKIDDYDKDGKRSTVTGAKPVALINALKAPAAPAAPAGPADLYGAEPGALAKGAKGPEVKAAQEKLIKAGYDLPRFGADGDYGDEMKSAVKQFQTDNKQAPTGDLDVATLEKLDKAPAASAVQFPEYGEMFKDGVMQTVVANEEASCRRGPTALLRPSTMSKAGHVGKNTR